MSARRSRCPAVILRVRAMIQRKIPVSVISGFLGAGKTTLVNHLMKQRTTERIGVIVNEFGEVGIDGQLIVADQEVLIEISKGCVCCTVRADLVASVKKLLARTQQGADKRLDRLIIETSGLADPAPVLQTFLADPDLREQVELESVITVVDAYHFRQQLGDAIVREQVAFADVVVINKADLVAEEALELLKDGVRALNRTAAVITATNSQVPADFLLGVRRFSLPTLLEIEPELLSDAPHDHEHDASIQSCRAGRKRCSGPGPVQPVDQSTRATARPATDAHERRAALPVGAARNSISIASTCCWRQARDGHGASARRATTGSYYRSKSGHAPPPRGVRRLSAIALCGVGYPHRVSGESNETTAQPRRTRESRAGQR